MLYVMLTLALTLASTPGLAEQVCDTSEYPLSSPTERFDDHGDGTVTDRRAMLMWLRCSAGQEWAGGECRGEPTRLSLAEADAYAAQLNGSGEHFFNDWRVPNLPELASIVERQCSDPRINLTVFPNTPSGFYWTSTSRPGEAAGNAIYALGFGSDGVERMDPEQPHFVRLVRHAP
jgi:hypothetical protein